MERERGVSRSLRSYRVSLAAKPPPVSDHRHVRWSAIRSESCVPILFHNWTVIAKLDVETGVFVDESNPWCALRRKCGIKCGRYRRFVRAPKMDVDRAHFKTKITRKSQPLLESRPWRAVIEPVSRRPSIAFGSLPRADGASGRPRISPARLRRVQCHRGANERLERLFINLVALMQVDGPPRVAFEAGVEET